MKWLVVLSTLLLSACSHVEFDEIASATSATAGCATGSAVAGPAGCVVGGAAAAVTTIVVTEPSTPNDIDITQVETPEQAEVAKSQIFWNFVTVFVEWILGAIVVLIIAAWLIPGPQFNWRKKDAKTSSPD